MSSDGKSLEGLVAIVEGIHLPEGFDLKQNERVFDDAGQQIAEFDIEIYGKVGTTTVRWLIECRDRPGHGAAPASWIEQLVGRRARFGFNKVTAVSTTGFAPGARDYASQSGIELREVQSLEPNEFKDWLHIQMMEQRLRIADVLNASIYIDDGETNERKRAALEVVRSAAGLDAILVSATSGEAATVPQAFLAAVLALSEDAFADVTPEKPKRLNLRVEYPTPDHFCISTHEGAARVRTIEFHGELKIQKTQVPVGRTVEYRHFETGERISQTATFEFRPVAGSAVALDLHHISETGLVHLSARLLTEKSK